MIDRDYSPPGQPSKKKATLQPSPKKNPPAPKLVVPQVDDDPYSAALKASKSPNAWVEKWMKRYAESPDQAIDQFLQLIIACCGCSGKLDAKMIHNMEIKDIITRLSDYFDEDSADYPLVMASPAWNNFRNDLEGFLRLFIIRCKDNIIYDAELMNPLIKLLAGLSKSKIRAFRHTTTFAAMKISSAIVDIVVELVELKEKNATQQIETEKEKVAQQMGSNERLELLLAAEAELDGKIEELSAKTKIMFCKVFAHRYNDVVSDIRTICFTELGNCIHVYPALFLNYSCLKYIGRRLWDPIPEVRLLCVSVLLSIYENPAMVPHLEQFTKDFKDRLVRMVMDLEVEVAVKTCHIFTHIHRAFPTLLTPADCVRMYKMVIHDCINRQRAVAAAQFVASKLLSPAGEGDMDSSGDANPMPDNNTHQQQLKDLVSFYKDGEVDTHPAYLVDSFIDHCPLLKDWQSMIDILLSDEGYTNDGDLIAIMSAAVKQAATGEHPPNRGAISEKNDLRLLQKERAHLTALFIPALPRLLSKYIADVDQEKVSNLLDIFLQFELDMYAAGRHEQQFSQASHILCSYIINFRLHLLHQLLNEMMQLIERTIEQHNSSDDIMEKIELIFQFINSNQAVSQFTETRRARIVDGIAKQLNRQLTLFMQNQLDNSQQQQQELDDENGAALLPKELDDETGAALLSNYRKLTALATACDIPAKWNLWKLTMDIMQKNVRDTLTQDLAEKAMLLCFHILTWDLERVLATAELNPEFVKVLCKRRDAFVRLTTQIVLLESSGVENAFLRLCDTLILFKRKLAVDHWPDHLVATLVLHLDKEKMIRITGFVTNNLFEDPAQEENANDDTPHYKIELRMKRRDILIQYVKLFVYGQMPFHESYNVLRYFTKFHTDYGDILEYLLQAMHKLDTGATVKSMLKALVLNYNELKVENHGVVDQNTEQFQGLRELAKWFALSFGVVDIQSREPLAMIHHDGTKWFVVEVDEKKPWAALEPLAMIHHDGIKFALKVDEKKPWAEQEQQKRQENFAFFEVLQEFSPKLYRQHEQAVLKHLDKCCPPEHQQLISGDLWESMQLYRSSLLAKPTATTAPPAISSTMDLGRGRGRRNGDDG